MIHIFLVLGECVYYVCASPNPLENVGIESDAAGMPFSCSFIEIGADALVFEIAGDVAVVVLV